MVEAECCCPCCPDKSRGCVLFHGGRWCITDGLPETGSSVYKRFFLCYKHGWNTWAGTGQGSQVNIFNCFSPWSILLLLVFLKGCPFVPCIAGNIPELSTCHGPGSGYCPAGLSQVPSLGTDSRSSFFLGLTHLQVINVMSVIMLWTCESMSQMLWVLRNSPDLPD